MKSLLLKIATALGISLLFATQANAYEIATPVNPTGNAWNWGNSTQWNTTFAAPLDSPSYYTKQQNAAAIFINKQGGANIAAGRFILNSVKSSNPITFKKGNYYSTIINFSIQSNFNRIMSMPAVNRINLPNNAPYKVMSISSSYVPCLGVQLQGGVEGACSYGGVSWNIIVQATRDDVGVFQLGLPNTDMFEFVLNSLDSTVVNVGTILVEPITEFKAISVDSINQEQQQAGEQAQQDGNTAGNQAQSDATNTGTSLISGAANIIGALTDTTAGTCNVNMNMGILNLGTQNFCQGDIGPIRPIIATITNVMFAFVSLRVFMFLIGVMFGLFDQFLGTKTETGGTNG